MGHRETRIAVNAWVDEGIAALVEALNLYPDLVSVSSCQEGPDGFAEVEFTSASDDGVVDLVQRVAADLHGWDACPAHVSLTWWFGSDTPLGGLRCPPAQVDAVAKWLRDRLSGARMTP